jgi:hypothetical protein
MPHDVFLSYSREDSEAVDRIAASLAEAGMSCFIDRASVAGGQEWVSALAKAVRESSACLFVASPASVRSRWTLRELLTADEARLPIVVLLLGSALVLPDPIAIVVRDRQHILGSDLPGALPHLVRALRALVDRREQPAAYADRDDVEAHATFRSNDGGSHGVLSLTLHPDRPEAVRQDGGRWLVTSPPDAYHGTAFRNVPWLLDCIATAEITHLDGDAGEWAGFELGALWPGHYYQVLVRRATSLRVARHWGDRWEDVAQRDGLRLAAGTARSLTIVRRGPRLHAFVDGLHALSCAVPPGPARLGLVIGRGLRVGFERLGAVGVDVGSVFTSWDRLETAAAKPFLLEIASSPFGPDDAVKQARERLAAAHGRPDRHETVLLVVGADILPQLHEGPLAQRLAQFIAAAGQGREFRFAVQVTDTSLERNPEFATCPTISLGGPATNAFTRRLVSALPAVETGEEGVSACHALDKKDRRLALFGESAEDTRRAVEWSLGSGLLDRFLRAAWPAD